MFYDLTITSVLWIRICFISASRIRFMKRIRVAQKTVNIKENSHTKIILKKITKKVLKKFIFSRIRYSRERIHGSGSVSK